MRLNFLKSNNISLNRGFTLIEMLVVVSIIAIVTALSAANYRESNLQTVLDMQANQFAQDLRKMQEWAVSAHEVGGAVRPGYGIYVPNTPSNSYIIYADNNLGTNNNRYDVDDNIQTTVNLDGRVEISSSTLNPASIDFAPPDPITRISNGVGSASSITVVFRIKSTIKTRSVVVNQAGLIYVQ